MWLNFASRFLVCPLVVWLGQGLGAVRFASGWQILLVGLLLAVLSIVMDLLVLPLVGNAVSTIVDFVLATAFIWLAGRFALGAVVTLTGAAIVGAILAASEWAMHSWLGAIEDRFRRVG